MAKRTDGMAKVGMAVAHTPPATTGAAREADDGLDLFVSEVDLFEAHAVKPPKRGPGRPSGSLNRTTLQMQRLLLARGYRDPAEFLAALVTMDTKALAAAIGGEDVERVLDVQRKAAADLMPYFHQRQPNAPAERQEEHRTMIVMGDLVQQKVQAFQRDSNPKPEASHEATSHESVIDQ
jgi:hypothetical protein